MMYDDEMLDAARASERAEIGAQVDSALDDLAEDPVLQSDASQLVLDKVRGRMYQLFAHDWDGDEDA